MLRKLSAFASATALLSATLAAPPVLAFERPQAGLERATMHVKIGDLNLRADPGADAALRRIRRAASAFCEDVPGRRLAEAARSRTCREQMMYLAVTKLDAPMVTARYDRSGSRPPILLASR